MHPGQRKRIECLTSRLTTLHFAPTEQARQHLISEGVPERSITVTGNTGIDAVLEVDRMLGCGEVYPERRWNEIDASHKLIW